MKKLFLTFVASLMLASTGLAEQMLTTRLTVGSKEIDPRTGRKKVFQGSGTIISGNDGLILSCAHIFPRLHTDLDYLTVELFNDETGRAVPYKKVPGQYLFVLHPNDLSLIKIDPKGLRQGKLKMAPANYSLRRGQELYSWGCRYGAAPTGFRCNYRRMLNNGRVIETSRYAAQGRSGGGLFASDGTMIGVLVTNEPITAQTQFIGPALINRLLARHYAKANRRPSTSIVKKSPPIRHQSRATMYAFIDPG